MYDMNDAELPRGSDLIPDGTFAKVTMVIRPGGVDGQGEADRGRHQRPVPARDTAEAMQRETRKHRSADQAVGASADSPPQA